MALASARLGYLVSNYFADYKAWSGAGQNCNVFVVAWPQASGRSDTNQRLASHKPAASQPLIRGWLATNWWPVYKFLVEKPF